MCMSQVMEESTEIKLQQCSSLIIITVNVTDKLDFRRLAKIQSTLVIADTCGTSFSVCISESL